MTDMAPIPIEELLAQRDWVRRLAGALVRDPNDADDLVQDAFASALRTPPSAGTPVRSWFAAVLRNRVRDAARRRTVAAEALPRVARGEAAAPSPADLTERAETERLVISLVLELDEEFRDAVLLRFWRGMEPAAIAELRGIPAATVRTRVHRALAEVRTKLERRDRDGRWRAVLLAPAGDVVGRPAPLLGSGAKAAAALAVVAGAGLWALVATSPATVPGSESAREPETSSAARRTAGERRVERDREPAPGGADGTPDAAARATPAAAQSPPGLVSVRVLGADGAPLEGAELWAISSTPAKDVATRVERVAATSAAGGAVTLTWPFEEGAGRVLARAAGLCGVSSAFDAPREPVVEIRLQPAWTLAGDVVDEDGRGVPGVRLHLMCDVDGATESLAGAATAADGRFELPSLPVSLRDRTATLEARADGFATEWLALAALPPPGERLRVTLTRSLVVTGRVVDELGRPVGDATVEITTGDSVFTGADGRFRSGPLRPGKVRLGVICDQHAAVAVPLDGDEPGVRDVGDIVVPAGERVAGRVLYADGSIAANVWVGVEDTAVAQIVRQGRTDDAGRFAFEHLGAGAMEITASGPSEGPHAGSRASRASARRDGAEVVLTLSPSRSVLVELCDAGTGLPVAADFVVIAAAPEDGGEGASTTMFDRRDAPTSSLEMTTMRDGPFLLTVRVKGYEDFGPERVVVDATRTARLAVKLRRRP